MGMIIGGFLVVRSNLRLMFADEKLLYLLGAPCARRTQPFVLSPKNSAHGAAYNCGLNLLAWFFFRCVRFGLGLFNPDSDAGQIFFVKVL